MRAGPTSEHPPSLAPRPQGLPAALPAQPGPGRPPAPAVWESSRCGLLRLGSWRNPLSRPDFWTQLLPTVPGGVGWAGLPWEGAGVGGPGRLGAAWARQEEACSSPRHGPPQGPRSPAGAARPLLPLHPGPWRPTLPFPAQSPLPWLDACGLATAHGSPSPAVREVPGSWAPSSPASGSSQGPHAA